MCDDPVELLNECSAVIEHTAVVFLLFLETLSYIYQVCPDLVPAGVSIQFLVFLTFLVYLL